MARQEVKFYNFGPKSVDIFLFGENMRTNGTPIPHHQMQMCIFKLVYIRHRFSYTLSTRFHQMANCLTFLFLNWDIVAQRSKIGTL